VGLSTRVGPTPLGAPHTGRFSKDVGDVRGAKRVIAEGLPGPAWLSAWTWRSEALETTTFVLMVLVEETSVHLQGAGQTFDDLVAMARTLRPIEPVRSNESH
jgi:hypothetical protein